jgi:hypothetical protein
VKDADLQGGSQVRIHQKPVESTSGRMRDPFRILASELRCMKALFVEITQKVGHGLFRE